jgi:hypothetical protein
MCLPCISLSVCFLRFTLLYSWTNGLAEARVKQLSSTCRNLRKRVAAYFELDERLLEVKAPPSHLSHSVITILRVLQAWVFQETILECRPDKFIRGLSDEGVVLEIQRKSDFFTEEHLEQVICRKRHPYKLSSYSITEQKGKFEYPSETRFDVMRASALLEQRFLSFATEKQLDLVFYWDVTHMAVYVRDESFANDSFDKNFLTLNKIMKCGTLVAQPATSGRGVCERPCGRWKIFEVNLVDGSGCAYFRKFDSVEGVAVQKLNDLRNGLVKWLKSQQSLKGMSCQFSVAQQQAPKYTLTSYGAEPVPIVDLRDLFSCTNLKPSHTATKAEKPLIIFEQTSNTSLDRQGDSFGATCLHETSWDRPLMRCIPEGARLLSVLASSRRKEHALKLDMIAENDDEKKSRSETNHGAIVESNDKKDGSKSLTVYLDNSQTKINERWKRMGSDLSVYVNENSVPATALPDNGDDILFCCASNTLDIKGGGMRAEGLTLLPPGRLFLLLTRLTFGLFDIESLRNDTLVKKSITWLSKNLKPEEVSALTPFWSKCIQKALDLAASSKDLGEELVCFPDRTRELCEVFDQVDGYPSDVWDLESNPFTRENYAKLKNVVLTSDPLNGDLKNGSGAQFKRVTTSRKANDYIQVKNAPLNSSRAVQAIASTQNSPRFSIENANLLPTQVTGASTNSVAKSEAEKRSQQLEKREIRKAHAKKIEEQRMAIKANAKNSKAVQSIASKKAPPQSKVDGATLQSNKPIVGSKSEKLSQFMQWRKAEIAAENAAKNEQKQNALMNALIALNQKPAQGLIGDANLRPAQGAATSTDTSGLEDSEDGKLLKKKEKLEAKKKRKAINRALKAADKLGQTL